MINRTFFNNIFKVQLKAMLFVSVSIFCLILLFDFAEMTRKYPISNLTETWFAIKLSLLRSPSTFCEILHYIYFITATFSLWGMCTSHQVTILKSIGQSPQQILRPFLCFAVFISVVWLFVLHPLGIRAQTEYNSLTNNSYKAKSNNNIWIDYAKRYQMIFIKQITGNTIYGLQIFDMKHKDKIFAQSATMQSNSWVLNNVTTIHNELLTIKPTTTLPENVISADLISLISMIPSQQDIYNLCKVYKIERNNGVSLKLYKLELHKLLANCANFILFALIAAIICFPINRYKTKTNITIKIISVAIALRFCNNILESLAYTGVISIPMACWSVVLISLCLSTGVLIWKEV